MHADAIWRFLESRRGEMFCTRCIIVALALVNRIDRDLLKAEGRGARRSYGPLGVRQSSAALRVGVGLTARPSPGYGVRCLTEQTSFASPQTRHQSSSW
jgi:hypothetical protein